ncbi:hypothetical protein IIA15_04295, partial [candidate division TA06 bacterium]|nr:hypothetical protein [candidate division TA06 bacterium]
LWSRIQADSTKQEAGSSSIRPAFRIPRVWVSRLSYGFASLFFAALISFAALKTRNGETELGSVEGGVSNSGPELVSGRIPNSEISGEIFVLEPFSYQGDWLLGGGDLRIDPEGEELFLLDQRSFGEDTLLYSLPVYSGDVRLTSY